MFQDRWESQPTCLPQRSSVQRWCCSLHRGGSANPLSCEVELQFFSLQSLSYNSSSLPLQLQSSEPLLASLCARASSLALQYHICSNQSLRSPSCSGTSPQSPTLEPQMQWSKFAKPPDPGSTCASLVSHFCQAVRPPA